MATFRELYDRLSPLYTSAEPEKETTPEERAAVVAQFKEDEREPPDEDDILLYRDMARTEKLEKEFVAAANLDPEASKAFLRRAAESDPMYPIYSALARDTRNWGDFLVEQLSQALARSKELGDFPPLVNVEKADDPGYYDRVSRVLRQALRSPDAAARARAAGVWEFCVEIQDAESLAELRGLLREDEAWVVRETARRVLEQNRQLPEGYKEPLLDRLRRALS